MTDAVLINKSPPRYARVAQRLVDDIAAGRTPVGDLLPTEAELCAKYAVSRHTVRAALREVQALGLVMRQQGVGTRVISDTPSRGYRHMLTSVDDVLHFATGTSLVDVTFEEVVAGPALAERGRFPADQPLVRIEAVRVPSDDPAAPPLGWSEVYVLEAYADVRQDIGTKEGAIGWFIEQRYGVRIMAIDQQISAALVGEDLSARLNAPADSPALHIERWYVGDDGRVFEYALSVSPAERYSFSMRLARDVTS